MSQKTQKKWINHVSENGVKWSTKTYIDVSANSFDCDTNLDTQELGLIHDKHKQLNLWDSSQD